MRALILFGLLVGLTALTGCAGVANNSKEAQAIAKRGMESDFQSMGDDWNMLWMTDRQYRLTKYQTR